MYPIYVRTGNPIGSKLISDNSLDPWGRFIDAQNNKKFLPKVFNFRKILKIREKKFINPHNILLFLFYTV